MICSIDVNKLDSAIRFFLYVLIFWLPYSPAVVESCVIISLILWLIKRGMIACQQENLPEKCHKKLIKYIRCFKPASSILNQPILFFLAICLLSVFSSAFFGQSLHNFLTKTLEWFIVYFLVLEVFQLKSHIRILLLVLIVTSCATALDSIIQFYFTHRDLFLGRIIEPGSRATAAFKTPNGLGAFWALAVPLFGITLLDKDKSNKYRFLIFLVFLVMTWSLVLTFSRGAWLGVALGGILSLPFIFCRKKITRYFIVGILSAVILSGFLFLSASGQGLSRTSNRSTAQWRADVWEESMEMIRDKPFFGHGINTYMRVFQAYRKDRGSNPTYAHNCYIQLTAETGIIGLFGFLWIFVDLFRKSLNKIDFYFKRDRSLMILSIGLMSGIFAFLVHSFFDTHFYSLQLSVYIWFMIGIQSVVHNLLKKNEIEAV